jgi:D-alanyl-D-alanine carboxypeptidase/D-alanyl-D-alanine-endopeptidase (penicillin-binding protein 4)
MLETWRIGADEMIVADGSGLSRYNLATADAMARVLVRMAADEERFAPYLASLPIAGRDGTLAGRLVGTAAEGNVRAKTGSFSNARTLAGYATTADGELLAFAVLANNFATAAAAVDRTIDSVVTRLASFSSRAE